MSLISFVWGEENVRAGVGDFKSLQRFRKIKNFSSLSRSMHLIPLNVRENWLETWDESGEEKFLSFRNWADVNNPSISDALLVDFPRLLRLLRCFFPQMKFSMLQAAFVENKLQLLHEVLRHPGLFTEVLSIVWVDGCQDVFASHPHGDERWQTINLGRMRLSILPSPECNQSKEIILAAKRWKIAQSFFRKPRNDCIAGKFCEKRKKNRLISPHMDAPGWMLDQKFHF